MEDLEITAATVEQAIQEAEERLGVGRDEFEVEILREGKSGILGVGSRDAVIRVARVAPVAPVAPVEQDRGVVETATEVLETLLELIGVEGKVELLSDEMPLALNVSGDDLGLLIGRRGQTMASLEHIARLIVAERAGTWLPLSVDVAGYKKRRRDSLQNLALYLAEQVKSRRRSITMEPMSAAERRVVHLALADDPDVTTRSMGDGDDRKVVILLKQS